MPEDVPYVSHQNILRYEEILSVCSIMANLGIKIVRVTGGEPLLRKGCVSFLRLLKSLPGIEQVSLTTNATLLAPHVEDLANLGIHSINVSLDSITNETYHNITGKDAFKSAWSGIETALKLGIRLKINCVPILGVNESEILPLASLAQEYPVSVRFIELMPTKANASLQGISSDEVFNVISSKFNLFADSNSSGFGPAKYFKADSMKGNIGLISALSDNFCSSCNRVRLSSEGYLKLCLHHGYGIDLREMLRKGVSDSELTQAIKNIIAKKPKEHILYEFTELTNMSKIGG